MQDEPLFIQIFILQSSRIFLSQRLRFLTFSDSFQPQPLVQFSHRFLSKKTTTASLPNFISPIVIIGPDSFDEFRKLLFVLGFNVSKSNRSYHFPTDELSKTSTSLDDAIRNVEFLAEGRKPDDDFDRVDVVGDNDELGFFLFDEGYDFVDPGFETWGPDGGLVGLAGYASVGTFDETGLFLGFGFGGIFGSQFKQLSGSLFIQSLSKLMDRAGDLQTLLQNGFLPLELDVFGPPDESREIPFWLDGLSDSKVFGSLFKKRIGLLFHVATDWRGLLSLADHGGES